MKNSFMIKQYPKIKILVKGWDKAKLTAEYFRESWFVGDKWEFMDDDSSPDLVVIHSSNYHYQKEFNMILQNRGKYGFKSFFLVITGESRNFYCRGVDYNISYKPDTDDNLYIPLVVYLESFQQLLKYNILDDNVIDRNNPKPYLCNFIYSNTNKKYFLDIKQREIFCKLLSKYKKVDCAGKSLNNTDRLKIIEKSSSNRWDAKIEFMNDYKFSIAFENRSVVGYVTEKIWHAYLSRTIPIYWGAPDISEYFNPQSFINCHDYDNFEEVIERVKEIDNDPELFNQYINAPIILDNSKLYNFTKEKISKHMDEIMGKVIKKREISRNHKYPRLYELYGFLCFIYSNPVNYFLFLLYIKARIRSFRKSIQKSIINSFAKYFGKP